MRMCTKLGPMELRMHSKWSVRILVNKILLDYHRVMQWWVLNRANSLMRMFMISHNDRSEYYKSRQKNTKCLWNFIIYKLLTFKVN
jgi:hypothetical protein